MWFCCSVKHFILCTFMLLLQTEGLQGRSGKNWERTWGNPQGYWRVWRKAVQQTSAVWCEAAGFFIEFRAPHAFSRWRMDDWLIDWLITDFLCLSCSWNLQGGGLMGPQLWQLSTLQIQQSGVIWTITKFIRTIMTIIIEHLPLPHSITENVLKFNGLSGLPSGVKKICSGGSKKSTEI